MEETRAQIASKKALVKAFGETGQQLLLGREDRSTGGCLLLFIALGVHAISFADFFSLGTVTLFVLDVLFFWLYPKLFPFRLYGMKGGVYLIDPSGTLKLIAGKQVSIRTLGSTSRMLWSALPGVLGSYLPFGLTVFFMITIEGIPSPPVLSIGLGCLLFSISCTVYPIPIYFFSVDMLEKRRSKEGIVVVSDYLDALVVLYLAKHPKQVGRSLKLSALAAFASTSTEFAAVRKRHAALLTTAKATVMASGAMGAARAVNAVRKR